MNEARPLMAADQTRAQLAEEAKRLASKYGAACEMSRFGNIEPAWQAFVAAIDRLAAEQASAQAQGWQPPQGWKVVPDSATHNMLNAANAGRKKGRSSSGDIYRAMLDAAPPFRTPSTAGGGVGEAL